MCRVTRVTAGWSCSVRRAGRSGGPRNCRTQSGRNARSDYNVAIRIGLHTGEAIQDGRDFHGLHGNFAARVASAARGDSVYVTSLTAQIARGAPEFTFKNPQLVHLRGFDEPAELFELDWQQLIARKGSAPHPA